jgi:multimeric flavodoxin WrbA
MKIVTVLASPKGMKGWTAKLVKPMIDSVEAAGAEHTLISFNNINIHPCKGCVATCHKKGECHQQDDDFADCLAKMLAADGIIFATPNYMFNVTAQLKLLLDRCSFPLHTAQFHHKYCATVVTCGGSDPETVHDYMKEIFTQFGFFNVGRVSGVELQFEDEEECAGIQAEASDLAGKLVEAIKNKTVYDDQEEEIQLGFDIMGFLVQTYKDKWPAAYKYWQENLDLEEIEM